MAFYKRYDQGEYRPQLGGFSFFPPVIKNLIMINLGAFLLQNIFVGGYFTFGGVSLGNWFVETFYLMPLGYGFMPWQLVTYMFLHGGFGHIFLNMLMLWMFGMEIENTWGSKKFLIFYFAAGLVAGLANLLIAPLFSTPGPTIGASGGVYGVLVAFAMLFPNRHIYIYFLLPVRAKYLITFFILLELYNGVTGASGGIAHVAHLGGAVVGAIWVVLDAKGLIDRWIGKMDSRLSSRKSRTSSMGTTKEAAFYDIKSARSPKEPETKFDASQRMIDDILDKISISGYASLTEEEKRLLLDASSKIHPDKGQE